MNKSRQQFEDYFNSGRGKLPYSEKGKEDLKALLLQVWQASRDSLLLTLPEREKNVGNYDYFTDGYNSGISACETVLLDNGVKIKNE